MTGKILPLYILAKETKEQEKIEKGIIIPLAVIRQPSITAKAVLVGESTKHEDMKVNIGDNLLFSPNVIRRFIHPDDKEEYLIVHQKDVLLYGW